MTTPKGAGGSFKAFLLTALVALLLTGCGSDVFGLSSGTPTATEETGLQFAPDYSLDRIYPSADLRFQPSVSYAAAVETVTSLGLQPLSPCTGAMGSTTPWRPISQQKDFAAQDTHGDLQVTVTSLTAPNWLQRLATTSGVRLVYDGPVYCPSISGDLTPVPGRLYFGGYQAPTEYLAVTFSSTSPDSYAQRIVEVSELGFRLANPCFEQHKPQLAWPGASQQAPFTASGRLILATTDANSQAWRTQLQAVDGIAQIVAPYAPAC
ncbi:MAG: hypothetical protein ACRDID_10510 [Ktedonobacterales bacterium]